MQKICTVLQTDNQTFTAEHNVISFMQYHSHSLKLMNSHSKVVFRLQVFEINIAMVSEILLICSRLGTGYGLLCGSPKQQSKLTVEFTAVKALTTFKI